MMTIKAEPPIGVSLSQACLEVIDLATRVGACIVSEFNGVMVMGFPHDDPAALEDCLLRCLFGGMKGPACAHRSVQPCA